MEAIQQIQADLRKQAKNPLANLVLTREVGSVKLSIQLDPCTWMYPGYGLQASISMEGGGKATVSNKAVLFADATRADLQSMFERVGVVTCKDCGKPAFDVVTVETNRKGLCEECFMTALEADFQKAMAGEAKRMGRMDQKHKANGYSHRVDAWIHPAGGGDDYSVAIYSKGQPSDELIQKTLKRKGSAVLDDYKVAML